MGIPNLSISDAYHEAGHAVAAVVLGIGLHSVDLRPMPVAGGGFGRAGTDMVRPRDQDILGRGEATIMPFLQVLFAGLFAERLVDTNAELEGHHEQSDGHMINKYAVGAVCEPVTEGGYLTIPGESIEANKESINALIEKAREASEALVAENRDAIEAVAKELLEKQVLAGADVRRIVGAG